MKLLRNIYSGLSGFWPGFTLFGALLLSIDVTAADTSNASNECVIALHGLARSAASMDKMQSVLEKAGYRVANIDYPSRKKTVQELAPEAIERGLKTCAESSPEGIERIHFVTHSMGGILLRQYLSGNVIENLGRVVMLAPPNQGSEVVDNLRNAPGFSLLNGPAGLQLGTDKDSVPRSLGAVEFDLGVIAGTRSINLILSTYLPNPDDGKVSLVSAQVEGMCDFLAVDISHPFIMKRDPVIEQVLVYFDKGRFSVESVPGAIAQDIEKTLQSRERPAHCSEVD